MVVRRSINSFAEKVKRLPHTALYRREDRLRPSDRARLDAVIARIADDCEALSHNGDARDYGMDMHVIRFNTADKAKAMQAWLDASDISNLPAPKSRTDIEQLKVGGGRCMNDNLPKAGLSRYLDVAEQWAAEHDWRHAGAARWIRGLAGGLHRLVPNRHGFRAKDIARVVQAWHGDDWEVWDGGFVVELRDGRRARLDCFALLFDWTNPEDSRVTVTIEPAGYDEQIANPWDPDHRLFEDGADLPELQDYFHRLATIN